MVALAGEVTGFTKITGANGGFDPGEAALVPGVSGGANASFQVLAWEGAANSTFASATIRGSSPVFTQPTGAHNPLFPNQTVLNSSDGTPTGSLLFPSITLAVVPEPSTIALGVLGGLGLLLRRRK